MAFNKLPLELTHMILTKLNAEDMQNIRLVCKLFYYVVPMNVVLLRKYHNWIFVLEHMLLNGTLEMFNYLSEFIKFDDIKDYGKHIIQVDRFTNNNNPLDYSLILVKEVCFKYCKNWDEANDLFSNKTYNLILLSCIGSFRFDILKEINDKLMPNIKITFYKHYGKLALISLIENRKINEIHWVYENFDFNCVYYEDIIINALLTNDMDYIEFVDKHFSIYSYQNLMDELLITSFNYDTFDTLILENHLDALEYIVDKLDIVYDEGNATLIDKNYDVLDFYSHINVCETLGYYEMAKYIKMLYKL